MSVCVTTSNATNQIQTVSDHGQSSREQLLRAMMDAEHIIQLREWPSGCRDTQESRQAIPHATTAQGDEPVLAHAQH